MQRLPIVILVGKPGAGKSTLGQAIAAELNTPYYSIGGFIRGTLGIPDPHISVDKRMVFDRFYEHLQSEGQRSAIFLDCHPYPEDYLQAVLSFSQRERVFLHRVLEIHVPDDVAIARLGARPRAGDPIDVRLKYYNDHRSYIDRLMEGFQSHVIDNSSERNETELRAYVQEVIKRYLL